MKRDIMNKEMIMSSWEDKERTSRRYLEIWLMTSNFEKGCKNIGERKDFIK